MPFCTNPDCPHRIETGSFAEYEDGITHCPECKKPLAISAAEPAVYKKKNESDLRNKILITIVLLAFFRLLCLIPLPGVDLTGFDRSGSLLGLYGFAKYSRISICALGIMPFISAYIYVELLSLVIPIFKEWRGRKGEGRGKLFLTARWVTLLLCVVQGFGIAISLERIADPGGSLMISSPGLGFRLITVLTMTAGTFLLLWIADRITDKGIGNGISLVMFSGMIIELFSELPFAFERISAGRAFMDGIVTFTFALLIIFLAVLFILFMESKEDNIKVRLKNGDPVNLPIKYNTAGTITASLAASFVMLPSTIRYFTPNYPEFFHYFQYGTLTYFITYGVIIAVLFFFFTSLYFDPDKILSFLKQKKGEPVLKEGTPFNIMLDKKLTRLALYGSAYMIVFSVLLSPAVLIDFYIISGLSLIALVSISLDIISEVKTRKNGFFVKIEEFQKPYEAKFIKNLLERNNIPCFLEGYYHRSLFYFFGPFIGISMYVHRSKESEALNILQIMEIDASQS